MFDKHIYNAINSIDAILQYWDNDYICRFANNAHLFWFGQSADELIDHVTINDLYSGIENINFLYYFEQAYNGISQKFEMNFDIGGCIRNCLVECIPDIYDSNVCGVTVFIVDISNVRRKELTELKIEKSKAEKLANHDYLTGLPNRVFLFEIARKWILNADKKVSKFGICILDIDGFKKINDSYGHSMGDEVLKAVVNRVKVTLRNTDIFVRFGGDEFVILIADIDNVKQVRSLANRIQSSFFKPIYCNQMSLNITISIGIAVYPIHDTKFENLLEKADKVLYEAKSAGKNCIKVFSKVID